MLALSTFTFFFFFFLKKCFIGYMHRLSLYSCGTHFLQWGMKYFPWSINNARPTDGLKVMSGAPINISLIMPNSLQIHTSREKHCFVFQTDLQYRSNKLSQNLSKKRGKAAWQQKTLHWELHGKNECSSTHLCQLLMSPK